VDARNDAAIDWNIFGEMKKKVTAKMVADFIEMLSPELISCSFSTLFGAIM